jgi:hypothetical protein
MLEEDFDYENQCQQIRKKNGVLLAEFSTWLEQAGLAAATGSSHHANLDFYLRAPRKINKTLDFDLSPNMIG